MWTLLFGITTLTCLHYILPTHSARIVGFFTFEGKSHIYFHEAMMKGLLAAGHHITVVSPFTPQLFHENFTHINSKIENHNHESRLAFSTQPSINSNWFSIMMEFLDMEEEDCRHVMSMKEIQRLENFDLMMVEMLPMYECYLPVAQKLGIPVIGTMSMRSEIQSDINIGNARPPSVLPAEEFFISTKMTFYERLENIIDEIELRLAYIIEERMLKKFFEELFPFYHQYDKKISLLFSNNHESVQPRAIVPNAINIGGILVKTASFGTLPERFDKFIEEAQHGVIFFSLGSLANGDILDVERRNALKNVFAKIPQRVIWKFDDNIDGLSKNVLLTEWAPQKEILAHKNVVAFISHCGISSMFEAIYFAKPLILVPVFADQPTNALALRDLGVGFYLNIVELTETKLLEATNAVINDTGYRRNMAKLSKRFKDDSKSPTELVVYWTEYVLRYKETPHLKWVGADMPLYQYLLLDVIAFIIVSTTCAFFLVIYFVRSVIFTLRKLFGKFYS